MSNTIELVTKLRDEISPALKAQGEAFDQFKQKVKGTGDESQKTSTATTQLGNAIKSMAGQFALGTLAANALMGIVQGVQQALRKLLSDAVRLTVEMEDLTGAMTYLYGDAAGGLIDQLDGISEATGYTRSALYGLTRDVGAMTAEFASTRAEAAMMAGDITQASADAAAALGMELGQASSALTAALRGSSRQARQLGIDIGQDAVQAELLAMGITQAADAVDEGTLIQARYNIAMQAMTRYAGAAAAEMNTLEGSQRAANAAYEEMALQIGDRAAPMLQQLNEAGANLLPVVGDILTAIVALLDTAISPIASSIEAAAGIFNLFRDAMAAVNAKIEEELPFLGDLRALWESVQFGWSDANAVLRELLGLQEAETATVSTQTAGFRTYTSALSLATEAEVRYALAMIERMNIMGALDPMVDAARQRLEALRVEAEAAADAEATAYTAAFQAKKDAGLETGGSGGGGGGGSPGVIAESEMKDSKDAYQAYLDSVVEAQEAATEALNAATDRRAEHELAAIERAKNATIQAEAEAEEARAESARSAINHALDMGKVIGDVLAQGAQDQITFAEGMEAVGGSMVDMIVQAATQAVMAYAAEAAAAAAASQAGIPVIGPILAAAAMGSMLALVQGLLGGISGHAAGYIVPGAHAGDRVPALLEPGERVLTRGEARDYSGGGSRGGAVINLTLGSMFSGASRSDLQKAARVLRDVMDAGGM